MPGHLPLVWVAPPSPARGASGPGDVRSIVHSGGDDVAGRLAPSGCPVKRVSLRPVVIPDVLLQDEPPSQRSPDSSADLERDELPLHAQVHVTHPDPRAVLETGRAGHDEAGPEDCG